MKIPRSDIAGIVLSGGKSSRMGKDKGLLPWRGKTLAEHQFEKLQVICQEVVVVANDTAYASLPFRTIPDIFPDKGPVGGIYSGMKALDANWYFVLGVDLPLVSTQWLNILLREMNPLHLAIVSQTFDLPQPLCGIYSHETLPFFEKALEENQLRLLKVLERISPDFLNPELFKIPQSDLQLFNVNLPEDYARLTALDSHEG